MTANVRITQVLLKRGNTAAASNYTGPVGEVVIDTGLQNLRIQDGTTPGGHLLSGTGGSNYNNANVKTYLGQFDGNLVPSANVTYSLGDSTHRWKELWLSGNTIHLGSSTINVDNGNLAINGIPVSATLNTLNLAIASTNSNVSAVTAAWTANAVAQQTRIANLQTQISTISLTPGPQGPQGEQGLQGPQGIQGIQGNTGPRGLQGEQGIQGNVGPQGPQGIQGIQGNAGPRGEQGIQGNVGPQGTQGNVGPTGPQGIQGNIGPQGPQGIQGVKGDRGDQGISVTLVGNVALPEDLNFSGNAGEAYIVTSTGNLYFWNTTVTNWVDIGPIVGPRGDKGDTGEQGPAGATGPQGDTGPEGPTGPQGEPGPKGDTGDQGPQGETGATGPQGPQGIQGNVGPQGPQGIQGNVGPTGATGATGSQGPQGAAGVGVPVGGAAGQVLAKVDGDDYHTEWVNQTGGGTDTGYFGFGTNVLYNKDDSNQGLYIAPGGESTSFVYVPGNSESDGTPVQITNTSGTGEVRLQAYNRRWLFGADGAITFPDNTIQSTAFTGNASSLVNGQYSVELDSTGDLIMPDDSDIWFNYGYVGQSANIQDNALRVSGGNLVVINTSEDGTQWKFTADGNLVLPTILDFSSSPAGYLSGNIVFGDGTVQNTAYIRTAPVKVGTGAEGVEGDLWYNTADGRLYVDVNNDGTITWVDASPSVIPGNMVAWDNDAIEFPDGSIQSTAAGVYAGNTAPTSGFAWYNTEDGRTYNKVDGVWVDANPSVVPGDIVTYNSDGNIALGDGGQLTWANGKSILSSISASSDRIRNGSQVFKVQNNGSVMFPDGSTQDTAYTGLPTDIAAYIIAGDGTSYNVPGALRAVQNDANWAFGFAHPGGETYYTRTTFWGASYNERGFQVYDNSINQSRFTVTGTGNVVIESGGRLVFPDGTSMTTAATGSGTSYGDSNVAAYLTANPQTGTYGNSNVASYLTSGSYATMTDISTAINSLIGSAPGTLDTLQEIAANLASEAGAIGSITNSIVNTNSNVSAANAAIATLQSQVYTNSNVASYLPSYSGNIAGLTLTDQFRLLGAAPSSLAGSSGDLAGAVRVDSNYIYYCTADYADQHYTAVAGTQYVNSTYYIIKGSYPQPQVGWLFTSVRYGADQVITGVVDGGGLGWGIQVSGVIQNNGTVTQDNNIGFYNPTYPTIWKQIPWSATDYSNVNVAAYLSAQGITSANIGGSQAYANTRVGALEANIGSFYTYANTAFTGGGSTYSNANVASYLPTYSGNIGAANIVTTGATSGNISGANYISANVFQVSTGIFWANGVAWSSSAGGGTTYTNANASAFLAAFGSNSISTTGNITAGNVNANQFGNSVGTTATYSGNVTALNIITTGTYGNITNANVISANNVVVSGFGVTMANRPAFRIYGGSPSWFNTSNVNLKGTSIVVDYNQGNYFNSTTGIFTAPVGGLYSVTLNARVGSNNGQNQMVVGKNGLATAGNVVVMWESDTNTGTAIHYGVSTTIKLAANDWLSANITVGNIQFDQNDSWTVTYIG